MSKDVEVVIRCPASDAFVIGVMLLYGGLELSEDFDAKFHQLGGQFCDVILESATGETDIDAYIRAHEILTEVDPADGPVAERFEVEVRDA